MKRCCRAMLYKLHQIKELFLSFFLKSEVANRLKTRTEEERIKRSM